MTVPELLHGVNVADFVRLFKRQRQDLYLGNDKGLGRPIGELTRWCERWVAETWPGASRDEQLKQWHELLAHVKG